MSIEEVDGDGLAAALVDDERAVLVDFWGPWCAPCRTLRPHLEAMSEDYADDVRFVAVNVEEHTEVGTLFDVKSIPTLLLVKEGETVRRFTGATVPSQIAAELEELT